MIATHLFSSPRPCHPSPREERLRLRHGRESGNPQVLPTPSAVGSNPVPKVPRASGGWQAGVVGVGVGIGSGEAAGEIGSGKGGQGAGTAAAARQLEVCVSLWTVRNASISWWEGGVWVFQIVGYKRFFSGCAVVDTLTQRDASQHYVEQHPSLHPTSRTSPSRLCEDRSYHNIG